MNSGHPLQLNFPFLERLHLRTIMYLSLAQILSVGQRCNRVNSRYLADQNYLEENIAWCEKHGIRICHIRMQSAKEPFIENDHELVAQALSLILDTRNYPILIHSNKGKHRWSSSKKRG